MAVDRPQRFGFRAAVNALSVAAMVNLIALAASAVGAPVSTPSIFAPTSTPAFAIRDLSYFVLGICAVIFIVVGGLLTYCVIRFRRRSGDEGREPPQVYGSNQIELAWRAVPGAIVAPPSMGLALVLTQDQLIRQVLQGGGNMPAYGKNLTPAEVTALVAFMQTLRPAQQPPARSAVVPATPGR